MTKGTLLEQAIAALNEGRAEDAERLVLASMREAPDKVPLEAILVLAGARSNQGRHAEALAFLDGIAQVPSTRLHKMISQVALRAGDMDRGVAAIERAIEIDPADPELPGLRLMARVRRGDRIPPAELESIEHAPATERRFFAVAMALNGDIERALCAYLPHLDTQVRREGKRADWYNWQAVEDADSIQVQSQRAGEADETIAAEVESIVAALDPRPHDRLLDVGTAGGLLASRLAPRVREVVAIDKSERLVDKARRNLAAHANVRVLRHDIAASSVEGEFQCVLMASVTPMFASPDELASVLGNIHRSMTSGARLLVSNNFDIASAPRAARRALTQEPVTDAVDKLFVLESMFWLDAAGVDALLKSAGFASCEVTNRRERPDGRAMFDLLAVK